MAARVCKQHSDLSVQIPEHTWGLDVKTFLADYSNWSNKEFQGQLDAGAWNYRCCPALEHTEADVRSCSACASDRQHRCLNRVDGEEQLPNIWHRNASP